MRYYDTVSGMETGKNISTGEPKTEHLTDGLNLRLGAEELHALQQDTLEAVGNGLAATMTEVSDMGEALDCLIVSARAYLALVEHLREIHVSGMN